MIEVQSRAPLIFIALLFIFDFSPKLYFHYSYFHSFLSPLLKPIILFFFCSSNFSFSVYRIRKRGESMTTWRLVFSNLENCLLAFCISTPFFSSLDIIPTLSPFFAYISSSTYYPVICSLVVTFRFEIVWRVWNISVTRDEICGCTMKY